MLLDEFVELVEKAQEVSGIRVDTEFDGSLVILTIDHVRTEFSLWEATKKLEELAKPQRPETIQIEVPWEWVEHRAGLVGLISHEKGERINEICRQAIEAHNSKHVSEKPKTKSGCPECRSTDVVFESHDQDYSTLDSDMRLPRPMGFRCLACGCEFELSRTPGTVPKIIEHGAAYQEAKTPIPEIEESKPGIQISKSGFRCSECASSRMTNPTGREWYSTDGGRIVELQCTGCMGKFVVECVG